MPFLEHCGEEYQFLDEGHWIIHQNYSFNHGRVKSVETGTIDILKADWKWFDADGLHKDDTQQYRCVSQMVVIARGSNLVDNYYDIIF